jgi:gamma-glutamyltranspeptidase
MSPTLVFDRETGELVISGGSPGGALIIHYTAKLLYATLNWGLAPQPAIDLPNFGSLNGPTLLEEGRFAPSFVEALRARGHEVKEVGMSSGCRPSQETATATPVVPTRAVRAECWVSKPPAPRFGPTRCRRPAAGVTGTPGHQRPL